MRRQKRKMTEFLILAVVLSLTACSGKTTEAETETQSESTTEAEFAGIIDVKTDWKATFEAVLMKERGIKPIITKSLAAESYQVYVRRMEKSFFTPSSIPLPASTTDKNRKIFQQLRLRRRIRAIITVKPRLYAEKERMKDHGN